MGIPHSSESGIACLTETSSALYLPRVCRPSMWDSSVLGCGEEWRWAALSLGVGG